MNKSITKTDKSRHVYVDINAKDIFRLSRSIKHDIEVLISIIKKNLFAHKSQLTILTGY